MQSQNRNGQTTAKNCKISGQTGLGLSHTAEISKGREAKIKVGSRGLGLCSMEFCSKMIFSL